MLHFFCVTVWAQDTVKVDSLTKVLETNISDRDKVDTYVYIAGKYCHLDSIKAKQYITHAIELAQNIDYPEGRIDALGYLAWLHQREKSMRQPKNYIIKYKKSQKPSII